jgi:hypothetical protein
LNQIITKIGIPNDSIWLEPALGADMVLGAGHRRFDLAVVPSMTNFPTRAFGQPQTPVLSSKTEN